MGKKGETSISIQSAGGDEQIAEMVLSKNKSLLQPPKADRIILLWNKRIIVLVQSERQSYTFWHNHEEFGGIEGMLKRVVTIHSAEDDSDEMMALLYVLSYILCCMRMIWTFCEKYSLSGNRIIYFQHRIDSIICL